MDTDEDEVHVDGPQGRYVRDKEVGEAVTGQLNKAGIKTTLRTYEFVNYLNNMVYVHKAGPVWLIGWVGACAGLNTGLGSGDDLSPHLASRQAVGRVLRRSGYLRRQAGRRPPGDRSLRARL